MERRRLAVTGAGGFVGRHVVTRAAAEGWHVVGLVRSVAAARVVSESGGHPAEVTVLRADLLSPHLADCRAVVHLAMIGSERGGETYESVNVRGTEEVAAAAARAGVPRVVVFSGLGVARYGQAPRSTNPYFLSKLAAEVALFRSGLETVVFRPSYVVGPGDPFVPRLVAEMAGGEVEQPGDGSYRLQPVAVGDAAAAVLISIEDPAPARPRVFDLVGPEPIRFDRFLERVGQAAGKSGTFRVRSVPVEEADRRARRGIPQDAAGRSGLPAVRRGRGPRPPRRAPGPAPGASRRRDPRRPSEDLRRMASEAEVAVVGSGVMAWAVAWELARAGGRPIVVPAPLPLPETGHVASGPAMPYAQAVRDIGHAAALETWRVYREGHERLRAFLAGLQGDCSYERPGAFLLALDRPGASLLADSEDRLREDGFAGEFLDHYMLETRLPLFGFAGGYWAEDDACLDARRLAEALRESAVERGAAVSDVGTSVREIATDGGHVQVAGDRGRVRAERVVLADAAVLPAAGKAGMTRTSRTIEAVAQQGFELPALARSGDGRFRWHASDGILTLEVDPGLDVEGLLARLTLRAPSVRGEAAAIGALDGRPLVGPAPGEERLFLACGAEPCGLALVVGRWIAEGLRSGRDPTPEPFRTARLA